MILLHCGRSGSELAVKVFMLLPKWCSTVPLGESHGAVFAFADDFQPAVADFDLPREGGVGAQKTNLVLMINRDSCQFEEEVYRQKTT